MPDYYGQQAYQVRFDWGLQGGQACSADVAVVVDVLSFSTSVCVAVERGMEVYPFPWRDDRASAFAQEHDATLAVGRLEASRISAITQPTLSPATLLTCPPVQRLVLPSPNGSTIAAGLNSMGTSVLIGCLRNAQAVAEALGAFLASGRSIAIVAAGERWAADHWGPYGSHPRRPVHAPARSSCRQTEAGPT